MTVWSMMTSRNKRLPQRTCIACRQVKDKKSLIRLVRAENGVAQIDVTGKKPGRGAYLCRDKACWELVVKKDRLGYALRTKLSPDNLQDLRAHSYGLLEES